MNSTVTILQASSAEAEQRWTDLLRSVPHRHAFDSLSLIADLAASQSLESRAIFVSRDGRDLVALLATFRRVGPFSEVVPPRLVPFSPLILTGDQTESEAVREAISILRSHLVDRYHRVVVTLAPKHDVAASLIGTGWKQDRLRTYILGLQSTSDDIVSDWSAGTRRLYRKHLEHIDVREDQSDLNGIVQLWMEAYARSSNPVKCDPGALVALIDRLCRGSECRVYSAHELHDGSLQGGLIVLTHDRTAYYWVAGSVPGPAMTVILGSVLARLRSEGFEYFDFLGANTPSIAEFKRRFGPELVEYPRLVASRSRIFEAMLSAKHTIADRTASL